MSVITLFHFSCFTTFPIILCQPNVCQGLTLRPRDNFHCSPVIFSLPVYTVWYKTILLYHIISSSGNYRKWSAMLNINWTGGPTVFKCATSKRNMLTEWINLLADTSRSSNIIITSNATVIQHNKNADYKWPISTLQTFIFLILYAEGGNWLGKSPLGISLVGKKANSPTPLSPRNMPSLWYLITHVAYGRL